MGSFKERHRLPELITALRKCDEAGIEIRALLVGNGPRHSEIQARIESLGIEHRVECTGHISHSAVPTVISACDVLYGAVDVNHVSNPIKCYEYLACERPVITSRTPEFAFIEAINAGVLLSEVTSNRIEHAIKHLNQLPDQELAQMGKSGREYVIENRTWDAIVKASLDS